MNSYLMFWLLLVGLITISIVLMTCASTEGFSSMTFIPAWRRQWGGGPPPWRGWRHRWGWGWPLGGWGRYGWGSSWGYDPRRYVVTYIEPFEDKKQMDKDKMEGNIIENPESDLLIDHPPNGPAPLQPSSKEPYQLLNDEFPSVGPPEHISCVNSRSCYTTDFSRLLEPSSYRQMTNNYKHGYPDSCSSPFQELVMSFYKGDGMKIDVPKNCM
jgi:hypothetical protein